MKKKKDRNENIIWWLLMHFLDYNRWADVKDGEEKLTFSFAGNIKLGNTGHLLCDKN